MCVQGGTLTYGDLTDFEPSLPSSSLHPRPACPPGSWAGGRKRSLQGEEGHQNTCLCEKEHTSCM